MLPSVDYTCYYPILKEAGPDEGLRLCSSIRKLNESYLPERDLEACVTVLNSLYYSKEILNATIQLCHENSPPHCTNSAISHTGNSSECERIDALYPDELPHLVNSYIDWCKKDAGHIDEFRYRARAIGTKDPELCANDDLLVQNWCVAEIAIRTNNSKLCKTQNKGGFVVPVEGEDFSFSEKCITTIKPIPENIVRCDRPYSFCGPTYNNPPCQTNCKVFNENVTIIYNETITDNFEENIARVESKYAPMAFAWTHSKTRAMYAGAWNALSIE